MLPQIAESNFQIVFEHAISFKCDQISSAHYSVLRLFTGFASAALIAWKLIVNKAIAAAAIPANKNIHQGIEVR